MFFYKIEPEYWTYIKSFLLYLNRIPEYPRTTIHDIEVDVETLNEPNDRSVMSESLEQRKKRFLEEMMSGAMVVPVSLVLPMPMDLLPDTTL